MMPSWVAIMAANRRSIKIALLPELSAGKLAIDESISCIHSYLLPGIIIKTSIPHANSKWVKIFASTSMAASDYLLGEI
ncbi:MAG TPA: hypothetical protein VN030_07680 [Cellvibrio sp.]|nr:hypothetical protein [Cellvibrio sp.]